MLFATNSASCLFCASFSPNVPSIGRNSPTTSRNYRNRSVYRLGQLLENRLGLSSLSGPLSPLHPSPPPNSLPLTRLCAGQSNSLLLTWSKEQPNSLPLTRPIPIRSKEQPNSLRLNRQGQRTLLTLPAGDRYSECRNSQIFEKAWHHSARICVWRNVSARCKMPKFEICNAQSIVPSFAGHHIIPHPAQRSVRS